MESPRVAIDTSVFMDYLNPQKNTNDHIDRLLSVLAKRKYHLCLDSDSRIQGEYESKIRPIIKNRDESGFERQMLQYWLDHSPKHSVPLDMGDDVMTRIKGIVAERKESLDRVFIYVAIHADTKLVTNDSVHIIDRRRDLRKLAKRRTAHNADFMTSEQASADLGNWPS
jgi:predicted nucleic acid-binding protein